MEFTLREINTVINANQIITLFLCIFFGYLIGRYVLRYKNIAEFGTVLIGSRSLGPLFAGFIDKAGNPKLQYLTSLLHMHSPKYDPTL